MASSAFLPFVVLALAAAPSGCLAHDEEKLPPVETRAGLSLPSQGFVLSVHVSYDQSFQNLFRNRAEATVDEVFEEVSKIFRQTSLGTTVKIDVVGKQAIASTLRASSAGREVFVRDYVKPNDVDADAYVLLSTSDDSSDLRLGIAVTGQAPVCNKFYRAAAVVEYSNSANDTAQNVAHEIGHLLGLSHDFESATDDIPTNRFSSNGSPCTLEGGYMDYGNGKNKWTDCSLEDFTRLYSLGFLDCLQLNGDEAVENSGQPLPCFDLYDNICSMGAGAGGCEKSWYQQNCRSACGLCE